MKKIVSVLLICVMITGCSARKEHSDGAAAEESSVSETESTSAETSSSTSEVSIGTSDTDKVVDETSMRSSSSSESTTSVENSSVNDTTSEVDNTSNKEETSSVSSSVTSSSTSTASTPSVPVVEEPTWTEEKTSSVLYVNKEGIYSRKDAVVGSAAVKKYGLNDKISVVAVTNTDYYKLEDGTFIHKDYLSTKETTVTPVTPAAPSTPEVTTPSNAEKLLNSAKLNPMKTNNDKLDALVSDVLSQITNDSMSTSQKVTAIYDYIVKTFKYGTPAQDYTSELNYHMILDNAITSAAYTLLTEKQGVCNDYSSLFVVMTRRIGLESYIVTGQVASKSGGTTGHTWTVIKLNGQYYIFDPQIEQSNTVNGQILYKFFCKKDSEMTSMYTYGVSSAIEICKMFYPDEPKSADNARDFVILFFGNFVIDEGECPYKGWTLVF